MIEKGKIQIGDKILDAEIEIETQQPPKYGIWPPAYDGPLKDDPIKHMRAYLAKFPTWGPPEQPKIVEGSVVHPIDEPGRLIEGGKTDA